jgi:hypothetical protein
LVPGLAHALQIDLRFRYTARKLKDVRSTRLAGNCASDRGDLIEEHGIGEDG